MMAGSDSVIGSQPKPEPETPFERLQWKVNSGCCTLSGLMRGDCEHAVGLPGKSIPNKHNGPDDTVDCYDKPNGWCWSCWKSKQLEDAQREIKRLWQAL